jgi:hypothetical protein
MKELFEEYNCHYVFASGSLPNIWDNPKVVENAMPSTEVVDNKLAQDMAVEESKRLEWIVLPKTYNPKQLSEEILALSYDNLNLVQKVIRWYKCILSSFPIDDTLVFMNTVKNSALMAYWLYQNGFVVYHFSGALSPACMEVIMSKLISDIRSCNKKRAVVGTSCVQSGVCIDGMRGFLENKSANSTTQSSGRVNREASMVPGKIYMVEVTVGSYDDRWAFNMMPDFEISANELRRLLKIVAFGSWTCSRIADESTNREIAQSFPDATQTSGSESLKLERMGNYPNVVANNPIIDDDTVPVLVGDEGSKIAEKLLDCYQNGWNIKNASMSEEVARHSISAWRNDVIRKPYLYKKILLDEEIYLWQGKYDPHLLGIYAEFLRSWVDNY